MVITITDMQTGQTVQYNEPDHDLGEQQDWPPFIWTEGNYSCDCNREIFFHRAQGLEIDVMTPRCGDGRYRVKIEQAGQETYDEGMS